MAARSSHSNNGNGATPLPVTALPLPADEAPSGDEAATQSLPTGSSGKLTPAQRARLGLDIYGDDQPAPPAAAPAPQQAPAEQSTSNFGFAEMDPRTQAQAAASEPRLAPVQEAPKLAPVRQVSGPVTRNLDPVAQPDPSDNASTEAGSRQPRREQTISERDGIAQVERDRSVLGYGVAWTAFCLVVAAAVSASNITADAKMGVNPSAFVPAVISIVLGWIVVVVGHRMRAWGWLMIVPAVVLVIGPFVFASWQVGKVESSARAFLSSAGSSAVIDIDSATILSSTINTDQGCFAMLKDVASGDVRVDVVTYAPQTAQQQATMALAPRYARRVQAGGARGLQRSFTLPGGKLPLAVVLQGAPPIDCANSTGK